MAVAAALVEAVNSARAEAKLKLRWPVREVAVTGAAEFGDAVSSLQDILLEACNSTSIRFSADKPVGWPGKPFSVGALSGEAFVDPARDEALLGEALFRELVRAVQAARKDAGLNVRDRVRLLFFSQDQKVASLLEARSQELAAGVGASSVSQASSEEELSSLGKPLSVELEGMRAGASFARS